MNKAVFLDRDGVICKDRGYIFRPADFEFETGAVEGLRLLAYSGYLLIVVTNQAGIAKGYYTEREYLMFESFLTGQYEHIGVMIKKTYYCPHHPHGTVKRYARTCSCRKPGTGMIERAKDEFTIDLSESWLVGDKTSDILAGANAGLKTILVETGFGGSDGLYVVQSDYQAADLNRAADIMRYAHHHSRDAAAG